MVETVEEAVAEARSLMFNQPGVIGMGTEGGRIVVDVRDADTRDRILENHGSTFAGFPLEVQVSGGSPTLLSAADPRPSVELQQAAAGRDDRYRPVVGGIQTGVRWNNSLQDWWGTLTGLFEDRDDGTPVFLSNKHVWGSLDGDWPRDSTEGTQPAARNSVIGEADRWAEINEVDGDSDETSVDAVGIRSTIDEANPSVVVDSEADEFVDVTGAVKPEVGMEIMKSGARTATTYGEVVQSHTSVYLEGPDLIIQDTFKASIESAGGDSGSIALDSEGRVVGQLFAGIPGEDVAWFNRVPQLLDELNVTPVTTEGEASPPFREDVQTQGSPVSVAVMSGLLPFALAATPDAIGRLRE